ncbi:MAG: amino acid adenylation domain-containing protein, partial [Rhodospirillaceae bacterium]|nr:amino acid adenylation domain-containing protein [Rhodospirillaceae bacterium]
LQASYLGMSAYNVPLALRVPVGVAEDRLASAFSALVSRWPVLGGRVEVIAGVAHLVPAGDGVCFEVVEGVELEALARRPFDLSAGPLLRGYYLRDRGILLLVVHHLVFDGVSIGLLLDAFVDAYEGVRHEPCSLAGYQAFTAAEQGRLSSARLDHWREVLADLPAPLALPFDRPPGAAPSFAGATLSRRLGSDLAARSAAVSKRLGIFPSTLFLGVWQGFLGRLCDSDDVIVGLPLNERGPAQDGLCGLFVNMVPLRSRGGFAGPFGAVLQGLQRRLLDDLSKAVPFPALVSELGLSGSGRSPVFQVGYFYQDGAPSAKWEVVEGLFQQGEYALTLELVEVADGGYLLHLKYDPELFDTASVDAFCERYEALLAAVLAAPEVPLAAHDPVSAQDYERLRGWNDTRRDYGPQSLPELFLAQAGRSPDAIAVEDADRQLSYQDLSLQSGALAAELKRRRIGPGDRVGLCLARSVEMVVGLLGILRAGASYVPLDPDYPAERLAYMLADSGARLVLTEGEGPEVPEGPEGSKEPGGPEVLELGALSLDGPGFDHPVTGTDAAYIIYTSGSSGLPKGVSVPHGALANLLHAMCESLDIGASDRLLAVTTVCFDIAALELFAPLLTGGCVLVCASDVARDGQQLKAALDRERPTIMQATPSSWSMLFHAGWANEEGLRVLCGGEALPAQLKARFDAIGSPVWNLYGPTETTIWSTLIRLDGSTALSIGRPIANTQVHILDQAGKVRPIGVAGELVIGGAGLALGYHRAPEQTAAVFIDHAFGRLYRTGDLARWRHDGTVQYLGRLDAQVKVRGHRVEPGEIEARLEAHGSVKRAAVVAQEGPHGTRLVAWCEGTDTNADAEADAEAAIDAAILRAHIAKTLPGYMVPDFIAALPELPRTSNNKIDRQALRQRPPAAAGTGRSEGAPEASDGVLEGRLLALWREVLEVEGLSRNDGFFEVGGNSISAVLLAERIGAELGRPFTVTELFRQPTVAALVQALSPPDSAPNSAPDNSPNSSLHSSPHSPQAAARERANRPVADGALAIVGISCRFPGAPDHRAFWSNLRHGRDSAKRYSAEELRAAGVPEAVIGNANYVPVQRGIEGKEYFDAGFFNIAPRNAALLDPQFRLLLEGSWAALEDAGLTPAAIPDTAVFMAAGGSLSRASLQGDEAGPGNSDDYVAWLLGQQGTLATLISYHLGLTGQSFSVHANCSSSLVGLQLAAMALRGGDVNAALVGACSLFPADAIGYIFEPGLNFSSDGRCKTFDGKADGMVAGEGAAVVLLKRAEDAIADGDNIYALIKGIALNNDGGDKAGFYAPSGRGQAEVIGKALGQAGIDPASIGLMEAHGTGTRLGDPIEVAALSEAWGKRTERTGYCAIGSVKTNIGHLDTAAGLAGCIKAALSLYHGEIPPTLHFETANPEIDFAASPFYPALKLQPWPLSPSGTPRRAALSAFGIGGTNAHAVLEQAPDNIARQQTPAPNSTPNGPQLIVLSAKSDNRLKTAAHNLATFLATFLEGQKPNLADLAHTLQTGRVHMDHRIAFVAQSVEGVQQILTAFSKGDPVTIQHGTGNGGQLITAVLDHEDALHLMERWLSSGSLSKLASLWVKGVDLDWRRVSRGRNNQRLVLPGYPFAREKVANLSVEEPRGRTEKAKELGDWGPLAYVCNWEASNQSSKELEPETGAILVVAPTALRQLAVNASVWFGEKAPDAAIIHISLNDKTRQISEYEWICDRSDMDCFALCLEGKGKIGTLLFIASENDQHRDEVQLLRLVQTLASNLPETARIDLYVISANCHPLAPHVPSTHSGLAGLGFAIAQGDKRFNVRNLDIDTSTQIGEQDQAEFWPKLVTEPADERGMLVRYEGDRKFQQSFHPLDWGTLEPGGIKQGGHYLLIGGSGVIGRLLSRHLIATFGATVAWVGRQSDRDPKIRGALEEFGGKVIYQQGDAGDLSALKEAIGGAEQKLGHLDGAFLMTMDVKGDAAVQDVAPDIFARLIGSKALGAANAVEALRHIPLDFLCAFSSVQAYSFLSAGNSAAYATGTVLADSILRTAKALYPIGLIHWGYWQASISGTDLEKRLAPHFAGLEEGEAWDFLGRFLSGLSQGVLSEAACLKASKDVRSLMPCKESLRVDTGVGPSFLENFAAAELKATIAQPNWEEPEIWIRNLLKAQLRRLGLFAKKQTKPIDELRKECGIVEDYSRWWDECLSGMLNGHGVALKTDREVEITEVISLKKADEIWRRWEKAKLAFLADPQRAAALELAEDCLRQLSDVLTGVKSPTEVIFPNASMDKVAKLYSGTAWTDSFNEQVADTVEAFIQHRISSSPGACIRILEIGAGTGSTTAQILPRLQAYSESVVEYRFTDVSESFLIKARNRWQDAHPYFATSRCDIERPLKDQGMLIGTYDLVIATNCLHATRDMRETISHARSALRGHGLLVVNEGVSKGLLITLIFGLLEGWWRYTDAELRIPGSPLLTADRWQRLFSEEGLRVTLLDGPARDRQQVILAENAGLIRGVLAPKPKESSQPVPTAISMAPLSLGTNDIVRNCLAEILSIDAASLERQVPFSDCGIDSILSVSFVNRLNEKLGIELNRSSVYDFPNVEKLSAHIDEIGGLSTALPTAIEPVHSTAFSSSDIAVIGMSLQTPGAANLDAFWKNLSVRNSGHTLEGKDLFDPSFFGLTDEEARAMNPHQRLIMLEGWKAFEDAGLNPWDLAGSRSAIYIGAEPCNWYEGSFTGASDAIIASRLSYLLDLKGPALVINTGCSSSGTAIHLACESLRRGEADLALAGGVAASLSEESLGQLRDTEMLSPSKQCRSFANDADGMVLSEAVGAVVLKRYDQASADGDPIYGVIKASGMNQDGASNGITAPNGKAQESLLTETWRNFGIEPTSLSHFEVHGTGTLLGDAVEGNALARAFRSQTSETGFCQLGLSKTTLGHTGAASGVIGLIKLMLCLRHRYL